MQRGEAEVAVAVAALPAEGLHGAGYQHWKADGIPPNTQLHFPQLQQQLLGVSTDNEFRFRT